VRRVGLLATAELLVQFVLPTILAVNFRGAPMIGIGRLLSVLPLFGIGRLVHWYWPIVIYTFGKYKFLLHDGVLLRWQEFATPSLAVFFF